MIMLALMYGVMPIAMTVYWERLEPVIELMKPSRETFSRAVAI